MISIQLPDGSKREFAGPVTVADVAASIGPGLAKAAVAGRVGDKLVDTTTASTPMRSSRSSPTRTPPASTSFATPRRTCSPTR